MKKSGIVIILAIFSLMFTFCSGNDKEKLKVHPYCSVDSKISTAETDSAADSAVTGDTSNKPVTHYGFASIYGKFFSGLDGSVITSTTHTDLEAWVAYSSSNGIKKLDASIPADADGYFLIKCIPTDTKFTFEINATNLLPYLYHHPGIADNISGDTEFGYYENDPNEFTRIVLFPDNVNPGNLTIRLYDADTGEFLSSADGNVLLKPRFIDGNSFNDYISDWENKWYEFAPKVSASIANGTASITGTDLVLGAQYDIEIYNVDVNGDTVADYQYNVSLTHEAGSEESTTINVNIDSLNSSTSAKLILLSVTNVTASSHASSTQYFQAENDTNRDLVFTFNQNVAVDPGGLWEVSAGGAGLGIIEMQPNGDENSDGTPNSQTTEGAIVGQITSFLSSTPSASDSTVTITFASDTTIANGGTIDTNDNLWYEIWGLLGLIEVKRANDISSAYVPLATFDSLDLNGDGIFDVCGGPNCIVNDALDVDGDNDADFLVRYPYN
jgi:hypothetical protein